MLGEHRDDYSWVFRALAFMNGRCVCGHQHVEFSKSVSDRSAVEARDDLTRIGIDVVDGADIAVVDLLVVVVLDLHHLIAERKGPAKPLDLPIAGRAQEARGPEGGSDTTRSMAARPSWMDRWPVHSRALCR